MFTLFYAERNRLKKHKIFLVVLRRSLLVKEEKKEKLFRAITRLLFID
jgi:hypothetical protein